MFFSPVDLFLPVSGCRLFLLKHTGVCNPVSSNSLMTGFIGLV